MSERLSTCERTLQDGGLNAAGGVNGTSSPASAVVAMIGAVTIPDVTPPVFVAGTPYPVGNGPNYVTIAVAASETATLHAMILRAGDTPPASSAAVVAGKAGWRFFF